MEFRYLELDRLLLFPDTYGGGIMCDRIFQIGEYYIRPLRFGTVRNKRVGLYWFLRNKPRLSNDFIISGVAIKVKRAIWSYIVSDSFYKAIKECYDNKDKS